MNYNKNNLIKIIKKYNECKNPSTTNNPKRESKKQIYNFNIKPRLNNSSFEFTNNRLFSNRNDIIEFENKVNFGIGTELEYILPYYKNKWALFIEPNYHNYQANQITNPNSTAFNPLVAEVDYQFIEVPLGIRYYHYLNKKSKLFADFLFLFDINFNSSIDFISNNRIINSFEIASSTNIGFGVGYKYNKYSIEIRYQTDKEIIPENSIILDSNFKTVSLIIGYTIF